MENTENTNKTTSEPTKKDGVSAQINLCPGSETHRRFTRLLLESGYTPEPGIGKKFVEALMDAYENQSDDNSETVALLERKVTDLQSENQAYEATLQNKDLEIADLQKQLEDANKTANENAVTGMGQLAQIEELKKKLDGAIIFKPNPVVEYFLNEMGKKTGKGPAEILQSLYLADLQNPMANNLPYIVTSAEIRRVMNQLKAQQDAGE